MITILSITIGLSLFGPMLLALHYVCFVLPHCSRCHDLMHDADNHVCPDGVKPSPTEDSEEWPA